MTTPSANRSHRPASQGLHYSFEKAGLVLDRQPIPWNAEAVLVEAIVSLPNVSADGLREYGLYLPGGMRIAAETSRPGSPGQTRVFFRLAVPPHTLPAEVRWRDRSLGQINLPLLTREEFVRGLTIAEPTVHVRLKDGSHACRAYVAAQAKEVIASMMLTSPTSLAPLGDLELSATLVSAPSPPGTPGGEGRGEGGRNAARTLHAHSQNLEFSAGPAPSPPTPLPRSTGGEGSQIIARHVVRLESHQLESRQALVVVPFAKPKPNVTHWDIRWTIGGEVRAARSIRSCRPIEFSRTLRISTTRLYLEGPGGMLPIVRFPPASWEGITRFGPVFLVSSGIPGMAAQAEFHVRVLRRDRKTILEMPPVTALVTDGPTMIAPGTLAVNDEIDSFELWSGPRRLGTLTVAVMPSASFTGEGGIALGRDDFAWSPEAEDLLQQKLGQLLGGS